MIDFIKLELPDISAESIVQNELLDFNINHNIDECYDGTSLLTNYHKIEAEFNQLKVIVYPHSDRIIISGSIHKFSNSLNNIYAPNQISERQKAKGFNGNHFSLKDLTTTVDILAQLLCFNPSRAILRNVEFGFNMVADINIETFLKGLISYRGKEFSKPLQNSYRQAEMSQISLKCYNKSLQYGIKENILRIEDKYRKMEALNRLGISTLNDLTKTPLLKEMANVLLKRFATVLFFDYTINRDSIHQSDIQKYDKLSNPFFWYTLSPQQQHYHKRKLQELKSKYSEDVEQYVYNLIAEYTAFMLKE